MDEGYIKLNRKILRWEWFDDPKTLKVFLYCLIMANWKDQKYRGRIIPRGSFWTSRSQMAEDLKMTERQIRTALAHLKETNEVTSYSTPRGSIITVVLYNEYQSSDQLPTNYRPTEPQKTTNKTTNRTTNYKSTVTPINTRLDGNSTTKSDQQNDQQNDQQTTQKGRKNDQPYKKNKEYKNIYSTPEEKTQLEQIEGLYLDEVRRETGACSTNG